MGHYVVPHLPNPRGVDHSCLLLHPPFPLCWVVTMVSQMPEWLPHVCSYSLYYQALSDPIIPLFLCSLHKPFLHPSWSPGSECNWLIQFPGQPPCLWVDKFHWQPIFLSFIDNSPMPLNPAICTLYLKHLQPTCSFRIFELLLLFIIYVFLSSCICIT